MNKEETKELVRTVEDLAVEANVLFSCLHTGDTSQEILQMAKHINFLSWVLLESLAKVEVSNGPR